MLLQPSGQRRDHAVDRLGSAAEVQSVGVEAKHWGITVAGGPGVVVALQGLQVLEIRVINAITGELLRELTLNPNQDYQPRGLPPGPPKRPKK